MNKIRISIIIAIYNVQKFLPRCIRSVLNQDMDSDHYEVILIDDGSTDSSYDIAAEFARHYPRIILLKQENRGAAAARNSGLEKARGEYVWFIDSDDYIEENCLRKILLPAEENNLDFLFFRLACMADAQKNYRFKSNLSLPYNEIMSGWEALKRFTPYSIANCIIKRTYLLENGLSFNVRAYRDDVEFSGRAVCMAARLMHVDETPYYYYYRPDSISRKQTFENQLKLLDAEIVVASSFKEFGKHYAPAVREYYTARADNIIAGLMIQLLKNKEIPYKRIVSMLNRCTEENIYPFTLKQVAIKKRMLFRLFNMRMIFLGMAFISRTNKRYK